MSIVHVGWLADSRANIKSFPVGVQDDFGYSLYVAQLGEAAQKPSRFTVWEAVP